LRDQVYEVHWDKPATGLNIIQAIPLEKWDKTMTTFPNSLNVSTGNLVSLDSNTMSLLLQAQATKTKSGLATRTNRHGLVSENPMNTRSSHQVKAQGAQTISHTVEGLLQRKCACGQHTIAGGECAECGNQRLQRHADKYAVLPEVPPIVQDTLRSPGQPLDSSTRAFMEPRFKHDFSHVRVHTDAEAAASALAVNARAYTVGHNLVFAPGEYKPQTLAGQRLLAHELTHVIQQRGIGYYAGVQPRLRVSGEGDAAEREADDMADRVVPRSVQALKPDLRAQVSHFTSIDNASVYRQAAKTDEAAEISLTSWCSPEQDSVILAAAKGAVEWLDKAITQLDAYLAKPKEAGNKAVSDALKAHFKSTDSKVTKYVRGQLNLIRSELQNLKLFRLECHESTDKSCDAANAYVPGDDSEKIVFCNSFFKGKASGQTGTLVHELAHAQVGGTPITDRAYETDRALKQLTPEEALTNAESYMLLARQLGTGKVFLSAIPVDEHEDCSTEWMTALEKALASAQRWNREAQTALAELTPENMSKEDSRLIGGKTQADIESLRVVVNKLASALASSINFECEPEGGWLCDIGAGVYWYPSGDLHICPSWAAKNAEDQVFSLLYGLYGYAADVENVAQRRNYALFAQSRAKNAPPTLLTILGSTAWNADSLAINFNPLMFAPLQPTASLKHPYVESGSLHQRMSNDLPAYQAPPCQTTKVTFYCTVTFYVDEPSVPRPAPFTPPRVSAEFQYMTPSGSFTKLRNDPRADYEMPGWPLETKIPAEFFKLELTKNGPLKMRFELQDPDTGITRLYEDTIKIEAERPCDVPKGPKTK
jgi:Domain of unknown function (DUF4157)/Lysine-specific metallo-endopeptidase